MVKISRFPLIVISCFKRSSTVSCLFLVSASAAGEIYAGDTIRRNGEAPTSDVA